jgi:hypothetical protein
MILRSYNVPGCSARTKSWKGSAGVAWVVLDALMQLKHAPYLIRRYQTRMGPIELIRIISPIRTNEQEDDLDPTN